MPRIFGSEGAGETKQSNYFVTAYKEQVYAKKVR
jgi:hypothetical protein